MKGFDEWYSCCLRLRHSNFNGEEHHYTAVERLYKESETFDQFYKLYDTIKHQHNEKFNLISQNAITEMLKFDDVLDDWLSVLNNFENQDLLFTALTRINELAITRNDWLNVNLSIKNWKTTNRNFIFEYENLFKAIGAAETTSVSRIWELSKTKEEFKDTFYSFPSNSLENIEKFMAVVDNIHDWEMIYEISYAEYYKFLTSTDIDASIYEKKWERICDLTLKSIKKLKLNVKSWIWFYYKESFTSNRSEIKTLCLYKVSKFKLSFDEWKKILENTHKCYAKRINELSKDENCRMVTKIIRKMYYTVDNLDDRLYLLKTANIRENLTRNQIETMIRKVLAGKKNMSEWKKIEDSYYAPVSNVARDRIFEMI